MCDIAELAVEWDKVEVIRNRLRDGSGLLSPVVTGRKDIRLHWAVSNAAVLTVVLKRMALKEKLKLPQVEGLRSEVGTVMKMNNQEVSMETVDTVAWDIRTMCTYVKRCANRKEASMELKLNYVLQPFL